jgi:hypothetical protein
MQEIFIAFSRSLFLTKVPSVVNYTLGKNLTMNRVAEQDPEPSRRLRVRGEREQGCIAGEREPGGAIGGRYARRPGAD